MKKNSRFYSASSYLFPPSLNSSFFPVLPLFYNSSALILQNCFLKSDFFRNFAPDFVNMVIV